MDRVEKAKQKALENDREYGGCAQSVLGALQEALGIGNKESFKALSVLAGGIARHGETCGAVIGALAALGLVCGRERIEDTEANKEAMDVAETVITRFKEEMKKQFDLNEEPDSTICRDIQELIYGRSFDLMEQEGFKAFLEAGGHSDAGCPKVCAIAAQVGAEEILKL